jgi:hypothetical protein
LHLLKEGSFSKWSFFRTPEILKGSLWCFKNSFSEKNPIENLSNFKYSASLFVWSVSGKASLWRGEYLYCQEIPIGVLIVDKLNFTIAIKPGRWNQTFILEYSKKPEITEDFTFSEKEYMNSLTLRDISDTRLLYAQKISGKLMITLRKWSI